MSGSALPLVGNCSLYLIVFANPFQIHTKYKYMYFGDFQFKYKYTKFIYSSTNIFKPISSLDICSSTTTRLNDLIQCVAISET